MDTTKTSNFRSYDYSLTDTVASLFMLAAGFGATCVVLASATGALSA